MMSSVSGVEKWKEHSQAVVVHDFIEDAQDRDLKLKSGDIILVVKVTKVSSIHLSCFYALPKTAVS